MKKFNTLLLYTILVPFIGNICGGRLFAQHWSTAGDSCFVHDVGVLLSDTTNHHDRIDQLPIYLLVVPKRKCGRRYENIIFQTH